MGHDRARLLRDTRPTPRDRIRSYASQVYDFICVCGTRAESGRSLVVMTYDFVSDESASGAPHRSRRAATAATPIQFLRSLDSPLPDLAVAHARTLLVTVVCQRKRLLQRALACGVVQLAWRCVTARTLFFVALVRLIARACLIHSKKYTRQYTNLYRCVHHAQTMSTGYSRGLIVFAPHTV